jgi:phosphatidylserine decarboxylase
LEQVVVVVDIAAHIMVQVVALAVHFLVENSTSQQVKY